MLDKRGGEGVGGTGHDNFYAATSSWNFDGDRFQDRTLHNPQVLLFRPTSTYLGGWGYTSGFFWRDFVARKYTRKKKNFFWKSFLSKQGLFKMAAPPQPPRDYPLLPPPLVDPLLRVNFRVWKFERFVPKKAQNAQKPPSRKGPTNPWAPQGEKESGPLTLPPPPGVQRAKSPG